MKYLKKYNESVNNKALYQKLVSTIELHLEDNPYFDVTQFISSEAMTGISEPYIYITEDFTNNEEMMRSISAYIKYHNGDTTKPAWYDIIAKFEKIVLTRNTELLTKIGKMYDLEIKDIKLFGSNISKVIGLDKLEPDFRKIYAVKVYIEILQSSEIYKTI